MINLSDFLKIKKVRCVVGDATITTNRVYDVIGLDKTFIHLIDDNGGEAHYWYCRFEPVLDESKSNNDAPHVKPKFKVGDPVYHEINGDIYTIMAIENGAADLSVLGTYQKRSSVRYLCHATQENYERLKATFPDIEFEQPPKELKGSEATKHILKENPRQICYVSDQSDFKCRSNDITELAVVVAYNPNTNVFVTDAGDEYRYAVPVDGNDTSIEIKI